MKALVRISGVCSIKTGKQFARGFSLISAIFLLVVLAALGAAMLIVSTTQSQSSALDLQGAQAYQAARAGVEWGLYQELQNNGTCITSTNPNTPLTNNIALPASLSGFTVTVKCSAQLFPLGTDATLTRRQITATACNQPLGGIGGTCPNQNSDPNYVQRVLRVEF